MHWLFLESQWRWEQLRTNLWLVPSVEVVGAVMLFVATRAVDTAAYHGAFRLPSWVISGTADAARIILTTLAAAVITVVGVVFSIMDQVHRGATGHIRLITAPVRYDQLVERAFDKIRQSSRGIPAVMIRQLDALTKIMTETTQAEQRQVLLDQAAMIQRANLESVPEQADRADVQRRYDDLLALYSRITYQPHPDFAGLLIEEDVGCAVRARYRGWSGARGTSRSWTAARRTPGVCGR